MEIELNTLLVTFFIQYKVNGKCGSEPVTARSTPLHFNYTVSQWLASMSPSPALCNHALPFTKSWTISCVPHFIRLFLVHDSYGRAWSLSHQYLYQGLLFLCFVVFCWCSSLTSEWGAEMISMCLIIMHSVYYIDSLMYLRGSMESWGRLVQQTFKGSGKALTMSAVCKDFLLN